MSDIKVGKVVAWKDVPDGAMLRWLWDGHGLEYFYRHHEHCVSLVGSYDGVWCPTGRDDGSFASSEPVTIVALGLTGRETADDLRRLAEVFEIRALLWEDACDQTWCVCIGQRDGEHYMLLDGWTDETANLTDEQALTLTAERLHAAGWRPGMSAEDADRLLAAEEAR